MSDRYRTTMNRISRSTTRLRPLLSIPKYARVSIGGPSLEKEATESVTGREEHEDHERHDQRHRADHRQHGRTVVVHSTALRRPAAESCAGTASASPPSSSPTRYTDPVASTAPPCSPAHRCAAASASAGRGSHAERSKPSWRASD